MHVSDNLKRRYSLNKHHERRYKKDKVLQTSSLKSQHNSNPISTPKVIRINTYKCSSIKIRSFRVV